MIRAFLKFDPLLNLNSDHIANKMQTGDRAHLHEAMGKMKSGVNVTAPVAGSFGEQRDDVCDSTTRLTIPMHVITRSY